MEAKKRINNRGHDIPEEDKTIVEKLLTVDESVAIMMANEILLAGIDTVGKARYLIRLWFVVWVSVGLNLDSTIFTDKQTLKKIIQS